MNIYITEEEYRAICDAEDQLNTSIEAGDEEYYENTAPILKALNIIKSKYKKARETDMLRKALYKQAKEMYPNEAPVMLNRIVSNIMKQERKGEKPW